MAKYLFRTVALLFTAAAGLLSAAPGEPGERPIAPGVVKIADDTLGDARGRYLSTSSEVLYFGVRMASRWLTPDGYQLDGGAALAVDLSASPANPKVSFRPSAGIVAIDTGTPREPTDTGNRGIDAGGAGNISGLAQSLHLAGDRNQAENLARIYLIRDVPETDGVIEDSRGVALNGMRVSAGLNAGHEAVVRLEVDGQGVVQQLIRGQVDGATGQGIRQSVELLGDYHRTANQLELSAVLRARPPTLQNGIGPAIDSLRGLNAP